MNDEALDSLEQLISGVGNSCAPVELRNVVLAKIHDQLIATKWERRLGRTALALVALGIGLNWAATARYSSLRESDVAHAVATDTIVEMGVSMAEATDPETGSQWARHWAALSGRTPTDRQVAEILQGARKSHSGQLPFQKES